MFGCDDVVFTRPFSLQKAREYLGAHEQVFGYSIRLGGNIRPVPENLSTDKAVLEWRWDCPQQHYNYPWELDCTLYRKEDVVRITTEERSCNQESELLRGNDNAGQPQSAHHASEYGV